MFSIKSFSIDSLLANQRRTDVVMSQLSAEHSSATSGDVVMTATEAECDAVEMEERTSASLCSNDKLSDLADDCCSSDSRESANDDDWPTAGEGLMKRAGPDVAAESTGRELEDRTRSRNFFRGFDDRCAMNLTKSDADDCKKTLRTFGNLMSGGHQLRPPARHHHDVDFSQSAAKPNALPASAAQLRPVSDEVAVLSAALTADIGASAFRSPPVMPIIDSVVAQNQLSGSSVVEMADSVLQRLAAQHRLQQHVEWLRRAAGCGVYIPRMLDFTGTTPSGFSFDRPIEI
jgi:hypothetical protein